MLEQLEEAINKELKNNGVNEKELNIFSILEDIIKKDKQQVVS